MNMKKIATALIVALVPLLALPVSDARAQYYDEDQLPKVKGIWVFTEDNVVDGCLPSPGVLTTEAELILRRSGIRVKRNLNFHILAIGATGFELQQVGTGRGAGACAASLVLKLYNIEELLDGSIGQVTAGSRSGIYVGPKDSFQNYLREKVNESVTELANEILKARANASSKSQ